jgi:hypothetical protein
MSRFWIPLLLLTACSSEDWSDPAKVATATADVKIIEAIVNQKAEAWAQRQNRVPTLLVLNRIGSASEVVGSLDRTKANGYGWGQAETWDAFFTVSARPLRIPPATGSSFFLISKLQTELARGPDYDWFGGGAGFPDSEGFFHFDALTLSQDGTEAIVLGSYICGGLCGSGSVYHLGLEAGVWRVAHAEWLWVS